MEDTGRGGGRRDVLRICGLEHSAVVTFNDKHGERWLGLQGKDNAGLFLYHATHTMISGHATRVFLPSREQQTHA